MLWDSAVTIGKFKVKNRIVFPPLSCNWADPDGSVTKRLLRFYKEIARGGCGMVVVAGTAVSPEGKGCDRSLCLHSDRHLSGFKTLAETIKSNKCFVSIQLMHAGGQGNPDFTGHTPVSPSGIKCYEDGSIPLTLTVERINGIHKEFLACAALAFSAGFQAVELHLAHGYLLHEFLSEHTNRRTDKYGGTLANRFRLISEIISNVRQKVPGLIIGVRVSGEDYLEDGINKKVNEKLLPLLQEAGVEYFGVTAGTYATSKAKHAAMARGEFFRYAREIKNIVDKPVIGVGKILDLEAAEKHLKDADCDMIAIGRGLVADPMMIRKVKNNQPYMRCTECDQCQYLRLGKRELSCPLRDGDA